MGEVASGGKRGKRRARVGDQRATLNARHGGARYARMPRWVCVSLVRRPPRRRGAAPRQGDPQRNSRGATAATGLSTTHGGTAHGNILQQQVPRRGIVGEGKSNN
eukprot:14251748-Alexandrium_andersonii.AAC.1